MLPGKTLTPREVLAILRRRYWLLPLPAATLLLTLVYSSRLPDVFQADMLIAIVAQRVPDEFVRSTVTLRIEDRLDAITVQIKSRTVLEPMINEFNLYPEKRARLPMEDLVAEMRDSIDVELERPRLGPRGPESTAFRVRFIYPDAAMAARVTQRLGSIFVDQNARDRGAQATATDEFLQVQLAEARERLEEQEKRVEAFRQKHGTSLPSQLQSNVQAVQNTQMRIQAQVEAIARDRDRKLTLERLYHEAENEPVLEVPAPAVVVPQSPSGAGTTTSTAPLSQQLASARVLLANLELRLTPEHPDIVRTKKVIADLEAKVAVAEAEAARAVAGNPSTPAIPAAITPQQALRRERLTQMRAELESLDRQTQFKETEEQRLRAQVEEYQRRIEAVPGLESEWAALNRDYDTMQASYRALLGKSEASKRALSLESRQIGESFRVLDRARVPARPVSPKRMQISAIGIGIGLALAIAIAALLEFNDTSFRTEAEVHQVLSVPVLAVVPYVESSEERKRRRWRWAATSVVALALASAAGYVFWTMRLWTVLV
jgi:polysaccharide chain length determinant protein (PEP-CTERM system associated)